jgi:hypothetical protein
MTISITPSAINIYDSGGNTKFSTADATPYLSYTGYTVWTISQYVSLHDGSGTSNYYLGYDYAKYSLKLGVSGYIVSDTLAYGPHYIILDVNMVATNETRRFFVHGSKPCIVCAGLGLQWGPPPAGYVGISASGVGSPVYHMIITPRVSYEIYPGITNKVPVIYADVEVARSTLFLGYGVANAPVWNEFKSWEMTYNGSPLDNYQNIVELQITWHAISFLGRPAKELT